MVTFTYEYKVSTIIIEDELIYIINFPLDNIEVFINSNKDILHVFKCDYAIRRNKDFKKELKNQEHRKIYIEAALNVLTNT